MSIPIAVEAVRIAFRLALHVSQRADYLYPIADAVSPEPWMVGVAGLTEESARLLLEDFNQAVVNNLDHPAETL